MAKVLNNKQAREFVTDDAFFKAIGGVTSVTADYMLSLSGFRSTERAHLKPLLDAFTQVAKRHGKSVVVLADDPSGHGAGAARDDQVHLVTHIVAKADENRCVVKRTHKYIAACVYGRWVVGVDWLRACKDQQALVAEDTFELDGDAVTGRMFGVRANRLRVQSETPAPLANHTLYFCPTTGAMGAFLAHHLPWMQVNTHRLAYTRSLSPSLTAAAGALPSSDAAVADAAEFAPPSSFDPDTHVHVGLPVLSRSTRATKTGYMLVDHSGGDAAGGRRVSVRVDPRRPIVVVRGAMGAGAEPQWTAGDAARVAKLHGWQVLPLSVLLRCVIECKAVVEVTVERGGVEERVVRVAMTGEEECG